MTSLRTNVADLLHRPGSRRTVRIEAPLTGLAVSGSAVADDEPVVVDVLLERVPEGIVVRGVVEAPWRAACSRWCRKHFRSSARQMPTASSRAAPTSARSS